jgi:diguanylate cyclase (GGDEF)-like protein
LNRLREKRLALPRLLPLEAYLIVIGSLGVAALAATMAVHGTWFFRHAAPEYWVLFAFTIVGELLTIRVARHDEEVTSSTAFVFAILLSFGVAPAVLAQAIASLLADGRDRKTPLRAAFNLGQQTISVLAAGEALAVFTDLPESGLSQIFATANAPGIAIAAGVYFLSNNILAGIAPALAKREPIFHYLTGDLAFQALTAGIFLSLAPIVVVTAHFQILMVAFLALPMIAIYRGGRDAVLMEHRALHDSLTELPNRALLMERLERALEVGKSGDRMVSVVMMDVDHFKEINDTLGHHYGDFVLQAIGPRLSALVRQGDTVARLGGDEFAVLLPGASATDAHAIAKEMLAALHAPFSVEELTLQVGASFGIACSPDHSTDGDTLLQRADVAMFLAKEAGSGVELYSAERDHYKPDRLILAGELQSALESGQIIPFFQPSVDLRSGDVVKVEALARWRHPDRGLLGAGEFVSLAEQLGLIRSLTLELLRQTLSELKAWHREGMKIGAALNISTRHLLDIQLPDDIARLLREQEMAPSWLTLEITESTIMADPERSQAVLARLHAMGVRLSIDDFGTGYSSLSYLRRLAVDELKIDRSFVTEMPDNPSNAVIVRSTIDLGHNLGLVVVAEGVETEIVWDQLTALGCDVAQGYQLSAPVSADELTCWLREYDIRRSSSEAAAEVHSPAHTVFYLDPSRSRSVGDRQGRVESSPAG